MTQAANFSVPRIGPASPTDFAGRADDSFDSLLSAHSGHNRPTYAQLGTFWLCDAVAGVYQYFYYDGATDHLVFSIDATTGVITRPGGTLSGDLNLGGKKVSNGLISDGDVRFANTADATKKLALNLAAIGAGVTRTLSLPNTDVTISSFAATLLDDATAASMWATLGAVSGKGSPSGYFKLPDGTIVQYGVTANPGADFSVTLPTTFPTAAVSVQVTPDGSSLAGNPNGSLAFSADASNGSVINIRPRFVNSGGSVGVATQNCYWLAIGY